MSGFYCISLDAGTREKVSNVREVVEIRRDLYVVRHSQSCVHSLFKRFLRDFIAVCSAQREPAGFRIKRAGSITSSENIFIGTSCLERRKSMIIFRLILFCSWKRSS